MIQLELSEQIIRHEGDFLNFWFNVSKSCWFSCVNPHSLGCLLEFIHRCIKCNIGTNRSIAYTSKIINLTIKLVDFTLLRITSIVWSLYKFLLARNWAWMWIIHHRKACKIFKRPKKIKINKPIVYKREKSFLEVRESSQAPMINVTRNFPMNLKLELNQASANWKKKHMREHIFITKY